MRIQWLVACSRRDWRSGLEVCRELDKCKTLDEYNRLYDRRRLHDCSGRQRRGANEQGCVNPDGSSSAAECVKQAGCWTLACCGSWHNNDKQIRILIICTTWSTHFWTSLDQGESTLQQYELAGVRPSKFHIPTLRMM